MRTLGKVAAVTGLIALCLWVLVNSAWPGYTHSYRLICDVEVDGQSRSGSSVFEVTWRTQPGMSASAWSTDVRGDAVFVDLGDRGALLIPNQTYPVSEEPSEPLRYLALVAFGEELSMRGKYSVTSQALTKLSKLAGSKILPSDEMPQFIWLKNINDQASAQVIRPSQFAEIIGGNAVLKSLTIEMTKEKPTTHMLEKKLPWLRQAAIRESKLGVITSPGIYSLENYRLKARHLMGSED
tara:strand:- start:15936 stop:16652 length:717 start_codon:yes stop_codon:yes gene_type:complete